MLRGPVADRSGVVLLWTTLWAVGLRLARALPLQASVSSSFWGPSSSGAPAVFSLTTSQEAFYEQTSLELRVTFLPSAVFGQVAGLSLAPLGTCGALLAEVGESFPAPLSCSSGNFSGGGQHFFSMYFGQERTFRPEANYSFVVPQLQLLRAGSQSEFQWLFEFHVANGPLLESATAMLEHDVWAAPATGALVAFRALGGKGMLPGSTQRLSFYFQIAGFPAGGKLLVTFFPLLLWDQADAACALEPGSYPGTCAFLRAGTGTGSNQLLIEPEEPSPVDGELHFFVAVMVPPSFLPAEPVAAVLEDNVYGVGAVVHGPYVDGYGHVPPPPLELYTRLAPAAEVVAVSDRTERAHGNAVTLLLRPGATLRGLDLQGAVRDVTLSVTASTFFRITGAVTSTNATALGTDRAPLLSLSADGRTITFRFNEALALGGRDHSVGLVVENPKRYFWAVTSDEPWRVTVGQGPRHGCLGCPWVVYEGEFEGPTVDFAITNFQVLSGSLLIGVLSEAIFMFQLIYGAEQLLLLLPEGFVPISCAFLAPLTLPRRERAFLRCETTADGVQVVNQPPGQPLAPLPAIQPLAFRLQVQHPPAAGAGTWAARGLDAAGNVVASTRKEDEVQLLLSASAAQAFSISAVSRSPSSNVGVVVQFVLSTGLQPGDALRVTAPWDFNWRFLAAEFSPKPEEVDPLSPLPVRSPAVEAGRSLELPMVGVLEPGQVYAFSARVQHPASAPLSYVWTLEAFGPGAAETASQRFEAASTEGYRLNLLMDVALWPWTWARSTTGPLTLTFSTTQAVAAGGRLVLRAPPSFAFTSTCDVSELRLDEGPDSSASSLLASSLECKVLTLQEVHIGLSPAGSKGGLQRLFLEGGARYATTLHSLTNPSEMASATVTERWHLETKDSSQKTLDSAPPIESFAAGAELPYAEVLPGGPSSGADLTAGHLQWVIIAFRVAVPTQPHQLMSILAAPGSTFETFCSVRDPPAHTPPFAQPVGGQLSDCRGLEASAELQIGAVWALRKAYVFQVQVRNAMPTGKAVPALEAPFRAQWRLCLDGRRQVGVLREPPRPRGLQRLQLLATSAVLGGNGTLEVRFALATSMPPGGVLTVLAPGGYSFEGACESFRSERSSSHFSLPQGTICDGAQLSELRLVLGPAESQRLLAHKPYAFSVGFRNSESNNHTADCAWAVNTATAGGQVLDRTQAVLDEAQAETGDGGLLLPLLGLPLRAAAPFAGAEHSVLFAFFGIPVEGNSALEPQRLELQAPWDRGEAEEASKWDFSAPSACEAAFLASEGNLSYGLRHLNLTTGAAACLVESSRELSLTFQPSLMSPLVLTTLEFAVRNPWLSVRPPWNYWRLRTARLRPTLTEGTASRPVDFLATQPALFEARGEVSFEGFEVVPAFLDVQLTPSSHAANASSIVRIELRPRGDVPSGAVLDIAAPVGFALHAPADVASLAAAGLEFLPGHSANEASLRFVTARAAGAVQLTVRVDNPAEPADGESAWALTLRSAGVVLARSSDVRGYAVYRRIEVAGLYGSTRELSSAFNFVRVTFRLPVALPRGGSLVVVSPPGFTLLASGFDRETLPASSASLGEQGELIVEVPSGLVSGEHFAFRFRVENPPEQLERLPWQLFSRSATGGILAAEPNVPAFQLEARFQAATLLPSTVLPLSQRNVVEVQLALGSSTLDVPLQNGHAFLRLHFPEPFQLSDGGCYLQLGTLGSSVSAALVPGLVLESLPEGSLCYASSPQELTIEVKETLQLGCIYHLGLVLENPLEAPEVSTWSVSTERNGAQLHVAADLAHFRLAAAGHFRLLPTDVTRGALQLLAVELRPKQHVRAGSVLELRSPEGFELDCSQGNVTLRLGLLPPDSLCELRGNVLRVQLPAPVAYAPYLPALVAGWDYAFAVPCVNPSIGAGSGSFQLRLVDRQQQQLLEVSDLPAFSLAAPLELLEVSTEELRSAGEEVAITVRFRAPTGSSSSLPVRALLLEGPVGAQISAAGQPCEGLASSVLEEGDTPLPGRICAGASESALLLQLLQGLPLEGQTYVFELAVPSPVTEPLVDSFQLSLLPGPGALPLFTGRSAGFADKVEGLRPLNLSERVNGFVAQAPEDSVRPPLSTVKLQISAACSRLPIAVSAAVASALAAIAAMRR